MPPYLVASLIWWLLGAASWHRVDVSLAWMLATASVLPIYYYLFLLWCCLLAAGPLSRLPRRGTVALLAVALAWQFMQSLWPAWRPDLGLFWGARNPFDYVHCFLAGWLLAGRHPRELSVRGATVLAAAALVAAVAYFVAVFSVEPRLAASTAVRGLLVFSVVAAVAVAGRAGIRVPAAAFLAGASYTVFLYHFPLATALEAPTAGLAAPLRLLVRLALPLVVCCGLVVASRRVLGRRSLVILGC